MDVWSRSYNGTKEQCCLSRLWTHAVCVLGHVPLGKMMPGCVVMWCCLLGHAWRPPSSGAWLGSRSLEAPQTFCLGWYLLICCWTRRFIPFKWLCVVGPWQGVTANCWGVLTALSIISWVFLVVVFCFGLVFGLVWSLKWSWAVLWRPFWFSSSGEMWNTPASLEQ